MAYENGNNIYNYFCEPLKYYSKDNQIFNKATQILLSFKPHELKYNIVQISELFEMLMGIPFTVFAANGKYIRIEMENKEKLKAGMIAKEDYENAAIWDRTDVFGFLFKDKLRENTHGESESISLLTFYDEELLDNYERDISCFYTIIKDYIAFYYFIESPSKSLVNIRAISDAFNNKPLSLLFVRNDGCKFEIELGDNDLDYILETVRKINGDK